VYAGSLFSVARARNDGSLCLIYYLLGCRIERILADRDQAPPN